MGEVYRARDAKLSRDVAIKVLPIDSARDEERLMRFKREAQVLASLNHPNIAAIYGFEDSNHVVALVMELVEGPTLADRIRSGALPVEETLAIAKQIAEVSSPLIMIGFLLVSPVLPYLVANGSHALFTATSTLALGQVLCFYHSKDHKHVWIASVLVAFAVLSRMGEGALTLFVFITLVALIASSFGRFNTAIIAAAILPFVLVLGAYVLMYYSSTGKYPFGTGQYLYLTFEQGHGLAYSDCSEATPLASMKTTPAPSFS